VRAVNGGGSAVRADAAFVPGRGLGRGFGGHGSVRGRRGKSVRFWD
jgi:hypothetical protein